MIFDSPSLRFWQDDGTHRSTIRRQGEIPREIMGLVEMGRSGAERRLYGGGRWSGFDQCGEGGMWFREHYIRIDVAGRLALIHR